MLIREARRAHAGIGRWERGTAETRERIDKCTMERGIRLGRTEVRRVHLFGFCQLGVQIEAESSEFSVHLAEGLQRAIKVGERTDAHNR